MKVITANFVTCSVKECKTSPNAFPLHFHDAELEMQELDFQPEFIRNVIPRIDWEALRVTAIEVPFQLVYIYMATKTDWKKIAGIPKSSGIETRG